MKLDDHGVARFRPLPTDGGLHRIALGPGGQPNLDFGLSPLRIEGFVDPRGETSGGGQSRCGELDKAASAGSVRHAPSYSGYALAGKVAYGTVPRISPGIS